MPPTIDELAPKYVRAKLIDLSAWQGLPEPVPEPEGFVWTPDYVPKTRPAPVDVPMANRPFTIAVSYERTKPHWVMSPLIFEVQAPIAEHYVRQEFLRKEPSTISFTPRVSGRHLLILREAAHNRFWGSMVIQVP